MTSTAQTFKLSRSPGFATIDRELNSDAARVLAQWAGSRGRSFREVGETAGFVLVELVFYRADAVYSARDLAAFCYQKQITPTLQW